MEIIHSYSRAQAIEDGLLIDVSETAREAGFRFPVAVTREAWERYIVPSEEDRKRWGQDTNGRLWDTLWMLRHAIKSARAGQQEILFKVYFTMRGRQELATLKAVAGPGDNFEPVITVMLPEED